MLFDLFNPQPDATFATEGTQQSKSEAEPTLQCDYDKNCIELYKKIEKEDWTDVYMFLKDGSWPGWSLVPDYNPKSQAMTVVAKRDEHGKIVSSMNALQLAVMMDAPFAIIRRLCTIYPQGVRYANHHGHLALHLALLFGASDDVVALLVLHYPDAINKTTNRGFTPLQAAMKGEDRARGMMIAVFVHYTKKLLPASSNQNPVPNKVYKCDYEDNCINLYTKIEEFEWEQVRGFLDSGYWNTGSVFDGWGGPDEVCPKRQVQTWVTRYDRGGRPDWSQLPLHVAILCGAPFSVTSRLIEIYPQAVRYTDDQGMLPVHLALLHNASDTLVSKLLLTYPDSVNKKSRSGLTPLDCALNAEDNVRGKYLEAFVSTAAVKNAKQAIAENAKETTADKTTKENEQKKKHVTILSVDENRE